MTVISPPLVRPNLSRGQRVWLVFLRLLGVIPWLWLAVLGVLAAATFFISGSWPPFDVPSPRTLIPWSILVTPWLILFILSIAAPLFVLLVGLLTARVVPGPHYRPVLNFFVIGEALFLLLPTAALFDPSLVPQQNLEAMSILAAAVIPFIGVVTLAAWPDIVTFRWTRWALGAILWGFALGVVAPFALQLLTWPIN